MALTIVLTPGYTFTVGELVTVAKLNLLGSPAIDLEGSISSLAIADGSVTTAKLADGALSADATGLGKMADGYLAASASGRAKMAANFFGVNATSYAFFAAGFFAPFAPVIGATRNLLVQYATAATTTVAADEVMLKDANNTPFNTGTISLTANITSSGANGLDTGSEASSTWYYIWVIYNGTTVASLLSASATAPTMPAGYTYKALVGAVRNNGSSDFVTFYQQDRQVWLNLTTIFTAKAAAGSNAFEAYQAGAGGSDVDLRTVVPPTAKRLRGVMGNSSGSSQSIAVAADANGLGECIASGAQSGGSAMDSFSLAGQFVIPLKTAQTFYWKSNDTSAQNRLAVTGYEL